MSFDRNSIPAPGPTLGPRVTWMGIRPVTESSSGIFVLRSRSATFCVRAGTHMTVVFRPTTPGSTELSALMPSPTISTSGLHSFDFSLPGVVSPGWLDIASSRLSVAG